MREIIIKVNEYKPGKVRVITYYGLDKDGSKAENIFTNNLIPLVAESLRIAMPQCITGTGQGDSIEEAQAKCDIATSIHEAGRSDDRPKP